MLGVAPKLITLAYGEGERGLALGLFSTAFATGISVGAPLGGIITTYLGWPFIFFINLPIGAGIFWASGRVLRPIKAQKAWSWQSFDLGEAVILAGTLGLLLLGLTWIQKFGWSPETLGALGLAALLGLALHFRERRRPDPLLHRELWRRWPFVAGSLAVVLTFAPVMGVFFLLPFFLEQVYHYTPGQTGFMLAALSASNALVAPCGGYLADRLGNLLILRTGAGLILAGLISLIFTGPDTSTLSLEIVPLYLLDQVQRASDGKPAAAILALEDRHSRLLLVFEEYVLAVRSEHFVDGCVQRPGEPVNC